MVECNACIVNAIKPDLDTHIFNEDALARRAVWITNAYYKGMHTFFLPVGDELRKYHSPLSMTSSICDPILLREWRRTIHNKLISAWVVGGSSFHFNRVVPIAELRQTEAPSIVHFVNALENLCMALCGQRVHRASE